ncbi:MAG: hypothetical protein CNLJKLNK_00630 [Holosporales bacterium]
MSRLIIISLSVMFMCGNIHAQAEATTLKDGEDIIIFGDDEDTPNENDDITDEEDEEENFQ